MNGVYLPRFCHHRGLTPQASCRMCVVRVDNPKIPKLQTACTTPVSDGMVVTTESKEVEETRAAMIEFLLSNHPVDCPVCDRAGECELQDQTYGFGEDRTRSQYSDKENFLERQISPFIYNDPQRCVVCKRCTRVCEEWMDEFAITAINRGSATRSASAAGSNAPTAATASTFVRPGLCCTRLTNTSRALGFEADADGLQLLL